MVAVVVAAGFAAPLWGETRAHFCIVRPLAGPAPCSFVVDRFTLVFWAIMLFGTAVVALIGTVAVAEGRTPSGGVELPAALLRDRRADARGLP